MPCRTDYMEEPGNLMRQVSMLKAALCAVMTAASKLDIVPDLYNKIDVKESGVTPAEIQNWWMEHQREDERRKQQEKEDRERREERERARQAALAKLSPEDRKWLNLG